MCEKVISKRGEVIRVNQPNFFDLLSSVDEVMATRNEGKGSDEGTRVHEDHWSGQNSLIPLWMGSDRVVEASGEELEFGQDVADIRSHGF